MLPAALVVAVVLGLMGLPVLVAAAITGALAGGSVRWRGQRAAAAAGALTDAVAEAVGVLASDLAAGRSPPQALATLVDECLADVGPGNARRALGALLRPAAETARLGGSVPDALRLASDTKGCLALARVAAAWQLAETTGAPIAGVLGRVAAGVRRHAEHVRDVRVELAGPRASARLLAGLPLIGLLMGVGLGARPFQVLLTTSYGQVALCVGIACELAGLFWTDRIARRAEAR